jgi:hypothetical protein
MLRIPLFSCLVLVSDVFTMFHSYFLSGCLLVRILPELRSDFLIVNSTEYLVSCFYVAMLLPGGLCLVVLLVVLVIVNIEQCFISNVGGEWSASRHGRFTPGERPPTVPIG